MPAFLPLRLAESLNSHAHPQFATIVLLVLGCNVPINVAYILDVSQDVDSAIIEVVLLQTSNLYKAC